MICETVKQAFDARDDKKNCEKKELDVIQQELKDLKMNPSLSDSDDEMEIIWPSLRDKKNEILSQRNVARAKKCDNMCELYECDLVDKYIQTFACTTLDEQLDFMLSRKAKSLSANNTVPPY